MSLSVVPGLQIEGKDSDCEGAAGNRELLDWLRCPAEKVHACFFFFYACPLTSLSHAKTFLLMLRQQSDDFRQENSARRFCRALQNISEKMVSWFRRS